MRTVADLSGVSTAAVRLAVDDTLPAGIPLTARVLVAMLSPTTIETIPHRIGGHGAS